MVTGLTALTLDVGSTRLGSFETMPIHPLLFLGRTGREGRGRAGREEREREGCRQGKGTERGEEREGNGMNGVRFGSLNLES